MTIPMKITNITVGSEIELRKWKLEYAPVSFALSDKNRQYLLPWLSWVPSVKTVKDSEKFIRTSLKAMEKDAGLELGIWYQNKLVGCLGLHALSMDNRRASVGYWLDQDHQGKGIMTQSVRALIDYCYGQMGLNRLEIKAAVDNKPSYSVAERLGFKKEGIARQYEVVNGRTPDYFVYSMLKAEWSHQG
jgi:ribosomal-protein-serine acetyltransferase